MKIIIAKPSGSGAAGVTYFFTQGVGETSSSVCWFFIESCEVVTLD